MPILPGRWRSVAALATAVVALAGGLTYASVKSRDMAGQLQFIDAANGGIVVLGTIKEARFEQIPAITELFDYTVLTVEVEQALAPTNLPAKQLQVYLQGGSAVRLSTSPPPDESAVGERVLMFLAADPAIRAHADGAYLVHSYAEIFRTQTNRKGQTIVLGEGPGSAIEANAVLGDVSASVGHALEIVKNAPKNDAAGKQEGN